MIFLDLCVATRRPLSPLEGADAAASWRALPTRPLANHVVRRFVFSLLSLKD